MGVNTLGLLDGKVTVEEVAHALRCKFGVVTDIEDTHDRNYKIIRFDYNNEKRNMSTFLRYNDLENYPFLNVENITLIDLNVWGSSIELIEGVLEEFGGYLIEYDTDGDYRYVNKN